MAENKHWLFSATSYYKTASLYLDPSDNETSKERLDILRGLLFSVHTFWLRQRVPLSMALMCLCILTVPQSQHPSTCLILHLWKHFRTVVAIHFSQRLEAFKGLHEWRKRLPCILHHQPTHPPFITILEETFLCKLDNLDISSFGILLLPDEGSDMIKGASYIIYIMISYKIMVFALIW